MKAAFNALIVLALLLSACLPVARTATPIPNTPAPSAVPWPTDAPTPLPSAAPATTLTQDSTLYAGPGMTYYQPLANLAAGQTVRPLGLFASFVLAEVTLDGAPLTGYIPKAHLVNLTPGLPVLTVHNVPWQPLTDLTCWQSGAQAAQGRLTLENSSAGYLDLESGALPTATRIRLTLRLSEPGYHGSIKLLGRPEPSQGDWWAGILRLDVSLNGSQYQFDLRDGSAEAVQASIPLPIAYTEALTLLFDDPQGRSFQVLDSAGMLVQAVNLTSLTSAAFPSGLFPDQTIYFGLSVPPGAALSAEQFSLTSEPDGLFLPSQSLPNLRRLADAAGIRLGTEYSVTRMLDARYCRAIQSNYNLAILSEFSGGDYWQGPGKYDFSALDRAVASAEQQGLRIRGSHLVWGATEGDIIPDWLQHSYLTRDAYLKILEQHVRALVSRYKGRVDEWSVANEAANRDAAPGADFWYDRIGEDYIALALQWAHEEDPDAVLIFNADNNQASLDEGSAAVVERMLAMVTRLKQKNVPLDAVGMQMHLLLPWNSPSLPQKEQVIETMQRFGALGVRVYVTEFDFNLHGQRGSQNEQLALQARLYANMLSACMESGVCDSFSTWGVSDADSWITCSQPACLNLPDAAPLLFDARYQPKPAYFAVQAVLSGEQP
jgi:endo-1,4-beta-xylanase